MKIVNDDNDFLRLDNSNKQDLIYNNSKNEVRLNSKVAADAEKNSDENKS